MIFYKGMRVLVLSPHTDDAELGAGGTIIKLIEKECEIYWIVFSIAKKSIPQNLPKNILEKEFLEVIREVGIEHYVINKYPVREFHKYRQDILEYLVKVRKDYNPDLVFTTSIHDIHRDHRVIAEESVRAFKFQSIISYEEPWNVIGDNQFKPTLYVSLGEHHIKSKISMLSKYKSQIEILKRPYFDPEYIMAWARYRGLQAGVRYAEAFEVIKWIW